MTYEEIVKKTEEKIKKLIDEDKLSLAWEILDFWFENFTEGQMSCSDHWRMISLIDEPLMKRIENQK